MKKPIMNPQLKSPATALGSDDSFRLLVESVKDYAILMLDPAGHVVTWNPGAERIKGYCAEEIIGKHFACFYPPEALQRGLPEQELQVAAKDGRFEDEGWRVRKDGKQFWANVIVTALRGKDGTLLGFSKVTRDLTERRQADEQIKDNEKTKAALKEVSDLKIALDEHAIVAITDAQGKITYVNDKFCAISKYSRQELLGQDHRIINSGHHPKEFIRNLWTTIAQGKVWKGELKNKAKDGSFYWVDTTIVPFLNEQGKPRQYVAIRADITARKQAEALDELGRANAELDRAARHKDEFLANMSHELRTPLNAILGMSELLTEQLFGPLTPRQAKSVATISSSGQHLLALINDILDLSKIEAGKLELHLEPLPVDEFCQSCLAFVRTQAMQKQVSVVFEQVGNVARFTADPKRFKQVLVNLLTNAVKFTPQGGRIGLTVGLTEGEGIMRFAVWDTGIGIALVDQTKLFQAFMQVDSGLNRSQEGTGLGLALVAKLVELHGGSVTLESEPGKGSCFIVTLPLTSPGKAPPVPEPEAAPVEPRQFRHALVVEDDPPAAEQFVRYLAELGLSSVVHSRGEGVLETALRERPDVILLDIQLPNESGWVALAKLKEHPQTRDIPVAVVSVVDEPGKARAMGAAAHFTKPIAREQLAAFLHRPFSPKAEPAPRPVLPAPANGPTILLAEDNETNIETLGAYLKAKGYAMHFALNGLAAVKLARELRPALILMDIQMPMMDGMTAIRELRADAAFNEVPIIALTALAMSGDRERCLAAGATDYMSKPVKLKELAELMEKLLPHTGEGGGI